MSELGAETKGCVRWHHSLKISESIKKIMQKTGGEERNFNCKTIAFP